MKTTRNIAKRKIFSTLTPFSPKLYIKLTIDILPKALWNSCEKILRIERVTSILLKTLKFLMAFAM
jgi:hypothetical protein